MGVNRDEEYDDGVTLIFVVKGSAHRLFGAKSNSKIIFYLLYFFS